MEGPIPTINNIDMNNVKSSIRYVMVSKMMEENFTKWMSLQTSINLIQKLIEDCKKPNFSLVIIFK